MRGRLPDLGFLLFALLLLPGCAPVEPGGAAGAAAARPPLAPERWRIEVLDRRPHDRAAYTQGLLWHDGVVYESTGSYGASSLRAWRWSDGEELARVDLDSELFGEGLALIPGDSIPADAAPAHDPASAGAAPSDATPSLARSGTPAPNDAAPGLSPPDASAPAPGARLVQLTWRRGQALVWSLEPLRERCRIRYGGEGWGLAWNGVDLVMSDGTPVLTFRDPGDFAVRRRLRVTRQGMPLPNLNELEAAGGLLFANLYGSDEIAVIDPDSGRAVAIVDASGLLTPEEAAAADVLNGIAYRPDTGAFLLTGKYWPWVYEVRIPGYDERRATLQAGGTRGWAGWRNRQPANRHR